MAKALAILFLVPLLSQLPFSSLALTQDFCVANLISSDTPAGYPCKPQILVTADDFFFGGLAKPPMNIPPFNAGFTTAYVTDMPGLNGLGLSGARVDIFPGGVAPLHTHPGASEIVYMVEGTAVAGFISADRNKVYMKTLNKGEIFVNPKGLQQFMYNSGTQTAVIFSTFSNSNPGLQIVDWALFKNNLPSQIINNVTFISLSEIRRLKAQFGGSG